MTGTKVKEKACNCANGPRTMVGGAGRRRFAMARPCCPVEPVAEPGRDVGLAESGAPPYRRFLNFIGWIVPTAILALIPKCPVCVASYAVIGSGVGFSLSAFAQLRLALIVLCLVSLAFVGTKSVLYLVTRIASKRHP
ncbi:MAG: hypothetical protein JO077_09045 [Verrucomicrobia bacterium]|nr:hypothetical protein [Verrucomicrobiota bacterium]